jgi:hypothetical protein
LWDQPEIFPIRTKKYLPFGPSSTSKREPFPALKYRWRTLAGSFGAKYFHFVGKIERRKIIS